jgi:hypothetical protein
VYPGGVTRVGPTQLVLTASLALGCNAFDDGTLELEGRVLHSLEWDMAAPLIPSALPASCQGLTEGGSSSSTQGSRGEDLWSILEIENFRIDFVVGSGDEELAHKVYGAPFVADLHHDAVTVRTNAGRKIRFLFWGDEECSFEPPPELLTLDAGAP